MESLKDRFRAAGIHFGISLAVAALAGSLVFGALYPYPFREISGGRSLFGILIGVDVIVGPLLTWLVFNRRKPAGELRRDLAIIALLQMAALIYGLWSMYQARPVYLVHEVDRFVVVSAADIDPLDLPDAKTGFQTIPFLGVKTIGLRDPKDSAEKLKAMELAFAGKDLSLQPRFWQELSNANREGIGQRSKPLEMLQTSTDASRQIIEKWLAEQQGSIADYRSFPLVSRDSYWTAVLNRNLQIVGYLPIDPF